MSVKNADPTGMYSHAIVLALEENIDLLQETLTRYRRAITYLRQENGKLRRLKNIQIKNDQEFRSMCQDDTVAFPELAGDNIDPDVETLEALLPEVNS